MALGLGSACVAQAQDMLDVYYPATIRVSKPITFLAYKSYLRANPLPRDLYEVPGVFTAVTSPEAGARLSYRFLGEEHAPGGTCAVINLPSVLHAGLVAPRQTTWQDYVPCGYDDTGTPPAPGKLWSFSDTFAFNAPVRRKTWDGMEFEASPMVQRRNSEPWHTTYWAYRLGLVEVKFEWDPARLSTLPAFSGWPRYSPEKNEFMLITLPPPIVEGEVTEYVNTENFPNDPGGHYYYASNDETRAILDSGRPGKWVRTGKRFKHGGYVSVCRFYGSVSPGPNSHFYTASDNECSVLKSIEAKPMPRNKQQFNFEGVAFYANVPIPSKAAGQPATCPTQSIPLYRAYNAAWGPSGKKNYDSNHRFSTSRADIDAVVAKGWNDEGMVMCVPA
jgi:hypothetical protein